MIEIETNLRRWGNSYGVVIPKEEVRRAGLRVDEPLKILLGQRKGLTVKDIFGKQRGWKGGTAEILGELDRELASRLG